MDKTTATQIKHLRRTYGNTVARRLQGRPLCLAHAVLRDGATWLVDHVFPDGSLRVFQFASVEPCVVAPDQVDRLGLIEDPVR